MKRKNQKKLIEAFMCMIVGFGVVLCSCVLAVDREIKITTYYPTPYGEYLQMDIQTIKGRSGVTKEAFQPEYLWTEADWRVEGLNVDFLDGYSAEEIFLDPVKYSSGWEDCRFVNNLVDLPYNWFDGDMNDIDISDMGCSEPDEYVNGINIFSVGIDGVDITTSTVTCCRIKTGDSD
ncbi:MAG: hypothetical protein P9L96_01705 [Candidatus Gygaella obscura]|nr:hypothetical protein [Candidatus Gygaella obscura]